MMNKKNYELPEPFKTAFERGDASIDYRLVKGASKTDHQVVRELGYEIHGKSDCTYYAVELKGLDLSSYGDWGTLFLSLANKEAKDLFLKMCSDNIIEPWRIREYIKVDNKTRTFDYDKDNDKWETYNEITEKWITTECPYKQQCIQ